MEGVAVTVPWPRVEMNAPAFSVALLLPCVPLPKSITSAESREIPVSQFVDVIEAVELQQSTISDDVLMNPAPVPLTFIPHEKIPLVKSPKSRFPPELAVAVEAESIAHESTPVAVPFRDNAFPVDAVEFITNGVPTVPLIVSVPLSVSEVAVKAPTVHVPLNRQFEEPEDAGN